MVPTYSLALIKKLVSEGKRNITESALKSAGELEMDESDIDVCVCEALTEDDFYKTMPAEKAFGLWQDVYRVEFGGFLIYLKVQINLISRAVIISFKLK